MSEIQLLTITNTIIEMSDKTLKTDIISQIESIISSENKKADDLETFVRNYFRLISKIPNPSDFSIKSKLEPVLETMKNLLDQFSILFAKSIVNYKLDELKELKNYVQSLSNSLIEKRKALVVDINANIVELTDALTENLSRYKKLLMVLNLQSNYKTLINDLLNTLKQLKGVLRQKMVGMNISIVEKMNSKIDEYHKISSEIEYRLTLLYNKYNISEEGKQLLEEMVIRGEKIPYKKFIQYHDELKFLIENGQLYVRV